MTHLQPTSMEVLTLPPIDWAIWPAKWKVPGSDIEYTPIVCLFTGYCIRDFGDELRPRYEVAYRDRSLIDADTFEEATAAIDLHRIKTIVEDYKLIVRTVVPAVCESCHQRVAQHVETMAFGIGMPTCKECHRRELEMRTPRETAPPIPLDPGVDENAQGRD